MKFVRFTLAFSLIAYLLFNLCTCSDVECAGGQTCTTATIKKKSSSLHQTNVQVVGKVRTALSLPGVKVYSLLDDSGQTLMVKASPIDGSVPEVGETVVVCGVVHEVINVNGEMKLVVLEELSRKSFPALLTLE